MGVWEYGSMGVWEYGSMGVWECGSVRVWSTEKTPTLPHRRTAYLVHVVRLLVLS